MKHRQFVYGNKITARLLGGLLFSVLIIIGSVTACSDKNENIVPSAPEPEVQTVDINFLAVGDDLLHGPIYRAAQKNAGGNGYNFKPIYELIEPYVKEADLAFVNQETPLGGTQLGVSSYPRFNSPQEVGDYLYSIGFNLISHANNHLLDKGEEGLKNTMDFWQSKEEAVFAGATVNDVPYKTPLININGVNVAFLAYTYGTNGLCLPSNSDRHVSYIDKDVITEQVTEAHKVADIVIVSMHWGYEYHMTPADEQKDLAKFLAGLDVDIIVGHHPHVIQTMEYLTQADGGKTLVIYSLGNFISGQNKPETMLGGMVLAHLIWDKETTSLSFGNVKFIPLVTQYGADYSNPKVYPWPKYSPAIAATHGIKDKRFSYDYLRGLAVKTVPEEFLSLE